MKRNIFKCSVSMLAAATLLAGPVLAADSSSSTGSTMTELENIMLEDATVDSMQNDSNNMYRNDAAQTIGNAFPSSFDLRDWGIVPEVKSQGNWGTCWGFATIAACEISILSDYGITAAQYEEYLGEKFSLSERQLVYFTLNALPEAVEGEDYLYPEYISQAGEGYYINGKESDPNIPFRLGGLLGYSANAFASGMGPVDTSVVPYEANDGTNSTASDWSVDESKRFALDYMMTESTMLPSPAGKDENGNYEYNEAGTVAIKKALLQGQGVSIIYYADQNMDPEARLKMLRDQLASEGIVEEDIDAIVNNSIVTGEKTVEEADADEQLVYEYVACVELKIVTAPDCTLTDFRRIMLNPESEEDTAEQQRINNAINESIAQSAGSQNTDAEEADEEMDAEELEKLRKIAEDFGIDLDSYDTEDADQEQADDQGEDQDQEEADDQNNEDADDQSEAAAPVSYMNTETYAQYVCDEGLTPDHGVCIVGWDDNYSVDNFVDGQEPPAPGAWIVRNSWGSDYGNDGYFYLSYYDKSINTPETFEFDIDIVNSTLSTGHALTYDFLISDSINSALLSAPVYSANVFTVDERSVLDAVNIVTSEYDVNDSVFVYLLNEDSESPTDGLLIDTVSESFDYAGYHTIKLNHNYLLEAGSKISVVQIQALTDADGNLRYALPYKVATNETFFESYNELSSYLGAEAGMGHLNFWNVGIVNEGESYVYLDSEWVDWKDMITKVEADNPQGEYFTYDNLPIKAYVYSADSLENALDYQEVEMPASTAMIGADGEYVLISVNN